MQRLDGVGEGSRAGINKQFLHNTVAGLKSHNRREEEEDCWRRHRLEQGAQIPRQSEVPGQRLHRNTTENAVSAVALISAAESRKFWAKEKRRAMITTSSATETLGATTIGRHCGGENSTWERGCHDNGTGQMTPASNEKNRKMRKRESRDTHGVEVENDVDGSRHKRDLEGDRANRKRKKSRKKRTGGNTHKR